MLLRIYNASNFNHGNSIKGYAANNYYNMRKYDFYNFDKNVNFLSYPCQFLGFKLQSKHSIIYLLKFSDRVEALTM